MGLTHSPKISTDGLKLCLDAANPRSYPGTGANITDLKTGKTVAALVNSPAFSAANGGEIQLDGTDDYLDLSSFASSCWNDLLGGAGTLIFYMKFEAVAGSFGGVDVYYHGWDNPDDSSSSGRSMGWVIVHSFSLWRFGGTTFDAPASTTDRSDYGILDDEWMHWVFTGDGSSNAGIYVNGEKILTSSNKFSVIPDTASQTQIDMFVMGRGVSSGQTGTYPDFTYTGPIVSTSTKEPMSYGRIAAYDRHFSDAEVLEDYIATKKRFS